MHRPHPRPSAPRVVFRVPVAAAVSMLLSLFFLSLFFLSLFFLSLFFLSGVGSARSGVVTAPLLVQRQVPQGQVLQTQVPQRHAVVVSDSILFGAEAQLTQRLRASGFSITFDASVSRSTLAGAGAVRARSAETTDTLIVSLGANDSGNPSTFRQRVDAVMAAAAHVPNVHWLTIREVRSYYGPANQVLRDASARYPNLHLVDWNAATLGRSDLTGRDGLHLNGSGAALLADLVTASVTGTAPPSATAPPSVTAPPGATAPVDPTAAPVVSGPSPGSAPVAPAPVETPTPTDVAGPSEAAGPPSSPELDRNWFVSGTDDGIATDAQAASAQADGEAGVGARVGEETSPVVAVLAVAALPVAVVPVAVLLVAAVLTAAVLAAAGRAVRSVPEASITRAQLRAARIAGARERHPTVAVVPAVPDELVSPVPADPVSLQS